MQYGGALERPNTQTQGYVMFEPALHIIPNLAGKQERIVGTHTILKLTGITKLDIFPKPLWPHGNFTLKGGDPGHIK